MLNDGGNKIGIEIIAEHDTDRIGCPAMVKRLTEHAGADMVMFLGDDTIPQPGFLQAALDAMASLPDGWGVVGLNTQPGNDKAHWLAHKRMLEHIPGGAFFPVEYQHCYCDDELQDIAKEMGRWAFAKDARVDHDHPVNGGPEDGHYRRAYEPERYEADLQTYWRRKRERMARAHGGVKLGIGFPLVDEKVYAKFFVSFACMRKPESYTFLLPRYPHGQFPRDIASVRNDIVLQALSEGCTHMMMADTDQVYPVDTLEKLMGHMHQGREVVGVQVHRRWPPFDPILYRGTVGKYTHVSDEECYSGKLVEVDATGTGCLMFDMRVFQKIKRPWFKFSQHEGKPVGEDIHFCSEARKAGICIHVDTSIAVKHLALHEITRGDHELYKKLNNFRWAERGQENGHEQEGR